MKIILAAVTLSSLFATACTADQADLSIDEGDNAELPTKTPTEPGGSASAACPDGQYEWTNSEGKAVCADPSESPDPGDQDAYDPGMPDPSEYTACTSPTPTPTTDTTDTTEPTGPSPVVHAFATGCANPTLYKSIIELYKFDLKAGKLKFGEHSTSRVTRYRWDWDPTANNGAGAYKAPVEDAKTSHKNHWAADDARLKRYALIDTQRTDVNGVGWKAYSDSAGTHCDCITDVGHKTDKDSCYGFVNTLDSEAHVCHSDTSVQVRNFQSSAGRKVTLKNVCGRGLVDVNAPVP